MKRSERVIRAEDAGKTLAEAIEDGRRAVSEGRIFVDGKRAKDPQAKLREGARVVIHAANEAPKPPRADLVVIFEDDQILVLDKAPGEHLNETETTARPALVEQAPGTFVVHRLDRDTSGVVALAKTKAAAARLSQYFSERRVEKQYLAVVAGTIADGVLDDKIGVDRRRPRARKVRPDGQSARTTITTLGHAHGLSSVRAVPHTGRTHQIRVHLSHHGAPIVGDRMYGGPMVVRLGEDVVTIERTMLHAQRLVLPGWPPFSAPIPADMALFAGHGLALDRALE